jgi:hypothetical protein
MQAHDRSAMVAPDAPSLAVAAMPELVMGVRFRGDRSARLTADLGMTVGSNRSGSAGAVEQTSDE